MIKSLCIIGSGKTALAHAKAANYFGCKIKYVYTRNFSSINFKKFAKHFKKVKKVSLLNKIGELDVDGFVLCVPWNLNDLFIKKYFLNIKKAVLFEKPVGFSDEKIIEKFKYKNNKYIALNRRFYENINYIKKKLFLKDVMSVEVTISENLDSFKKKFKNVKNKYIVYNTAIHIIDILVYVFGEQKVEFKKGNLNSTKKSLNLILNNKLKIPIFCNISFNTPENNSIKFKMNNRNIYELKPIETLTKYNGMKITTKNNIRKYIPNRIFSKAENSDFKPGFKTQMNNFLFQKKNFKLREIKKTNKLIKNILK